VEFSGIIRIGRNYSEELMRKYQWYDSKPSPPAILSGDIEYSFKHSDEFDDECSDSFVGYFYFDNNKNTLYFKGEY
jgi:hypothetical protein